MRSRRIIGRGDWRTLPFYKRTSCLKKNCTKMQKNFPSEGGTRPTFPLTMTCLQRAKLVHFFTFRPFSLKKRPQRKVKRPQNDFFALLFHLFLLHISIVSCKFAPVFFSICLKRGNTPAKRISYFTTGRFYQLACDVFAAIVL